ncbi:MAG: GreA/GreB family elongation factor [Chthoniobacter sp.]|nr:GreA/GreB family elongation factor [Chthoniobacter sp.]
MKKPALLKVIITRLEAELALSLHAARAAAAGATDEQNKAENKYDTRGLELSYLAAGQVRQMAEAEATIEQFRALLLRDFGPGYPIDLSAVVSLDTRKKPRDAQPLYFLAPRGGGTEVCYAGRDILVITPQSPLGQQLLGRRQGDVFSFGPAAAEHRIANVW